jgi:hypothetical protein
MSADEYRARAELARQQARSARSRAEREAFLEIERLWTGLAERAPRTAQGENRL